MHDAQKLTVGEPCLYRSAGRWYRAVVVELNPLARTALVRPAHVPLTEAPMERRFKELRLPKTPRAKVSSSARTVAIDATGPAVTPQPSNALMAAPLRPVLKPPPRLDAPAYRRYLAQQPCCACPPLPCGEDPAAPSEVHHYGPRGVGRRAGDGFGAPLCRGCHRHFHRFGCLPERTPAQSRELLHRVQVACLMAYLEDQAERAGAGAEGERLRLLRLVVGLLQGELAAHSEPPPRRSHARAA